MRSFVVLTSVGPERSLTETNGHNKPFNLPACRTSLPDFAIGLSETVVRAERLRMRPPSDEIPFGHAFDKRGVSSSKGAARVGGLSVFDQPSRSAPYSGCRAA